MSHLRILLLSLCALLVQSYAWPHRSAASPVEVLSAIRLELQDYGPRAEKGLDSVARLNAYIENVQEPRLRDEARYLRVATAAELYFIAVYTGDLALQGRLSALLGAKPQQLEEVLHLAVSLEERGAFSGACTHIRALLALIPGGEFVDPQTALAYQQSAASAAQLVALAQLAAAVDEGAVLAEIAESMGKALCAQKADCDRPRGNWPPLSRWRWKGLQTIGQWLQQKERAAAQGDALANALLPRARQIIADLSAQPVPLTRRLHAPAVPEVPVGKGAPIIPWLTFELQSDGVLVRSAPRAQLTDRGDVALRRGAEAEPISLPARPSAEQVQEFKKKLEPLCAHVQGRQPVALQNGGGAKALVFSTMLHGLHDAGCDEVTVLSADKEGVPRGLFVEPIFLSRHRSRRAPSVEVHVRPAKILLTAFGNQQECPRIRTPHRARRLQWEQLDRLVSDYRRERAILSYAGWTPLEQIVHVMPYISFGNRVRVHVP